MLRRICAAFCLFLLFASSGLAASPKPLTTSVFTSRPEDTQALEFARPHFDVHADGVGDDAPALQAAIDQVNTTGEKRGILFVPSGTYRLSRTINVWRGVRIIGYGPTRPVFLLGENTPGFQGEEKAPVFFFGWDKPKEPLKPGETLREAGASGFFAAIINADIRIAQGNQSAVGAKFHAAQHSFFAHVDFYIGDGYAGLLEIGNLVRDCRFFGGMHGIDANRTAPTWPFVLMDSSFEGQRGAAIRTEEAGLTVIRTTFRNVPKAIEVNAHKPEQLWVSDSRFLQISGPAITLSDVASTLTQANLRNIVLEDVPTLLVLRETGETVKAPAKRYVVRDLAYGLQSAALGARARTELVSKVEPLSSLPTPVPSDVLPLPPVKKWVNARALGARGDGVTDDTAALQKALKEHAIVYLPMGHYVISDTLHLREGGALIGLHASSTRLMLAKTAAAFSGQGDSVPMLASARGGKALVSGIALDTDASPRAMAIDWRAGADSMIDDVCFVSSHSHSGQRPEVDQPKFWGTQGPSLWVRDGGGGTFVNIWTANTTARWGLKVTDTKTPGRIYVMSAEHHPYREVQMDRVANWSAFALQTEAEGDEGRDALQLELNDCENLSFTNLFMYRVSRTRTPYPHAVQTKASRNLQFYGLHLYSPTKYAYDRVVRDVTSGQVDFSRNLARLVVNSDVVPKNDQSTAWQIRTLADGFEAIDGVAVRPDGSVAFVDWREGKVFQWSEQNGATLIATTATPQSALAVDPASGALFGIVRDGTVTRWSASTSSGTWQAVAQAASDEGAKRGWLRATSWFSPFEFKEVAARPVDAVWNLGSVGLPVNVMPKLDRPHPWVWDATWRSYGLKVAKAGGHFFAADEFRIKTYKFKVAENGSLIEPTLFAEVGEGDIVEGRDGRIYIANGVVHVFGADGKKLDEIKLPERPTSLALSADGATLYVGARSALYAVTVR